MLNALGAATTNTAIGDAMLAVATEGAACEVLDPGQINELAALAVRRR